MMTFVELWLVNYEVTVFLLVLIIWWMFGDKYDYVLMLIMMMIFYVWVVNTWRCKWGVNHEDGIYIYILYNGVYYIMMISF